MFWRSSEDYVREERRYTQPLQRLWIPLYVVNGKGISLYFFSRIEQHNTCNGLRIYLPFFVLLFAQ
jgi:hypothetical protein